MAIDQLPEGFVLDEDLSSDLPEGFVLNVPNQKTETKSIKSSFPFISDERLERNIKGAYESSKRESELFRGAGKGLGNALIGFVQGATDVGESAARAIEKAKYGDIIPQETFGTRLAEQIGKRKQEQANLPMVEKTGIQIGEVAPYALATTRSLVKGAAAASALASFFSPQEEQNLEKRAGKAIEAGTEGALYAGTLKLGGNIIGDLAATEPVQKALSRTKDFATALKDRLVSQFGTGEASKIASETIAKKNIAKGFKNEGVNAKELLENLQKNDHDLIDALDPRFATYGKVKGALNSPENIKKVDASLANIKQSTDDLQKSLTSMVATKQLTPEEAGEVLGRNAKKIFERAQEGRRLKADPYYIKGLNSGTKIDLKTEIPVDAQTLSALGVKKLTLGNLVNSNLGQDIINTARGQSEYFAKTPGGKFYGELSKKTKPEYEEIKKMAGSDIAGSPVYQTEQVLKKPSGFKIPDNDVRTLYAMENVLADRIGNVKLTGASKEEAALIATKKAISNLLDKANPDLEKARGLWGSDTKNIKSEGKSLVGKLAKMYDEGRKDDLAKASMNILDLPNRAIKLVKKSAPEDFNEILRSSLENKIAAIKPLDDSAIGSKPFYNALFKDGGKNLETALDNKEVFNGFKKLAVQLDRGQSRQRLAKGAMESEAKGVNVLTGKTSFINRMLEKVSDVLLNSPKAQAKLVDYSLGEEGLNFIKELAKEKTAKGTEKTLLKVFAKSGLITKDDVYRALAVAGGKNDLIDIFPDAEASEPDNEELMKLGDEERKRYPGVFANITREEQAANLTRGRGENSRLVSDELNAGELLDLQEQERKKYPGIYANVPRAKKQNYGGN